MWCWILLWPEEIDITVIVLCRRLLRRMCITEGSLALDTPQNKSRSRLLFQAYDKQTNNVDASSRLDWPQTLVRGCQFTFTYTTKSFVFQPPPPPITEEWTSWLDNINLDSFPNPLVNQWSGSNAGFVQTEDPPSNFSNTWLPFFGAKSLWTNHPIFHSYHLAKSYHWIDLDSFHSTDQRA